MVEDVVMTNKIYSKLTLSFNIRHDVRPSVMHESLLKRVLTTFLQFGKEGFRDNDETSNTVIIKSKERNKEIGPVTAPP